MTDSTQQQPAARMPAWMAKYPCLGCGTGYGQCREFVRANLMCCKNCSHPDHKAAQPHPWTADELEEMWAGRKIPAYIAEEIAHLRR